MKNLTTILMIASVLFIFSSCEKEGGCNQCGNTTYNNGGANTNGAQQYSWEISNFDAYCNVTASSGRTEDADCDYLYERTVDCYVANPDSTFTTYHCQLEDENVATSLQLWNGNHYGHNSNTPMVHISVRQSVCSNGGTFYMVTSAW